jgi:CBS domain-containing protein
MSIPDLMNASPETVLVSDRAVTALERMRRRDKPTAVLPVVDSTGCPVGMLHLHDLVSAGI